MWWYTEKYMSTQGNAALITLKVFGYYPITYIISENLGCLKTVTNDLSGKKIISPPKWAKCQPSWFVSKIWNDQYQWGILVHHHAKYQQILSSCFWDLTPNRCTNVGTEPILRFHFGTSQSVKIIDVTLVSSNMMATCPPTCLTEHPSIAVSTDTAVSVDIIYTCSSVLTWGGRTFIYVWNTKLDSQSEVYETCNFKYWLVLVSFKYM